jgi:hypothetical protein
MSWLKTAIVRGDSNTESDKIRDLWGSATALSVSETKTQELIGQVAWVGEESYNILKENLKIGEIVLQWDSEKYFVNPGPEEKRLVIRSKEGVMCYKRFRPPTY